MLIKGPKAPKLIWMNTVELKEVTWLWYPYIPAGSATMIFGPGGHGKSHIAVDIAARVTTGRPFPGEKDSLPAQNVLMMSAEDELDRVLGPRLVKAGADLSKVIAPNKQFTLDKEGLRFVEEYIDAASVGIVFVDPVVAYIGGKVDINKANETREFTGGLHQLAMRSGVPIVMVHHSRKGNEGADWERAMGSVDFNNAVRSVMFVTTSPDGNPIMKHVKANYSPTGPTQGFDFDDGHFRWTGIYTEDGTQSRKPGPKAAKIDGVKAWLAKKLADGPVKAVQIEQAYKDMGYSRRTVLRAKEGLAQSELVSENGKLVWYWKLAGDIDDPTDVPVMDSKWADKGQSGIEREIAAREGERASDPHAPVVKRGPLSDIELTKWLLEN